MPVRHLHVGWQASQVVLYLGGIENLDADGCRLGGGRFLFGSAQDARARAKHVVEYFADFDEHRSHNMGIARDSARAQGVAIGDLEDDNELQGAVLSVHHTVCTPLIARKS